MHLSFWQPHHIELYLVLNKLLFLFHKNHYQAVTLLSYTCRFHLFFFKIILHLSLLNFILFSQLLFNSSSLSANVMSVSTNLHTVLPEKHNSDKTEFCHRSAFLLRRPQLACLIQSIHPTVHGHKIYTTQ